MSRVRAHDERGFAMVLVIGLVTVLGVISLTLIDLANSEAKRSRSAVVRDASYQAAEAGAQRLRRQALHRPALLLALRPRRRVDPARDRRDDGRRRQRVVGRARLDVPVGQGRLAPALERLRVQPPGHAPGDRRGLDPDGLHRPARRQHRQVRLARRRDAHPAGLRGRLPDARERQHLVRLGRVHVREDLRRHRLERRPRTTSTIPAPPTRTSTPRAA